MTNNFLNKTLEVSRIGDVSGWPYASERTSGVLYLRRCEMKKSAEEILKGIRKRFKENKERNMRLLNVDKLYAEVARCIQPIKDKKINISKLNIKRGNHWPGHEGFPLQHEEISAFCGHIEKGLDKVERIFYDLKYFSSWKGDEIRTLKIQAESHLTEEEENEIDSFLLALRFILIKRFDMNSDFGRKVTGLKKRIKNLQRIITEEKEFEEVTIGESRYMSDQLKQKSASVLRFNKKVAA
jgi:hypothetical protein